jgi:polyhydroxyalkanoate synthase
MNQISSEDIIENIKKAGVYYQEIMVYMLSNKMPTPSLDLLNNQHSSEVMSKVTEQFLKNPEKFAEINMEYIDKFQQLVSNTMDFFTGKKISIPPKNESEKDKRFKDPAWQQNIYFDFIRQYYLISTDWIKKNADQYELDLEGKRYLNFATEQFINALSPSNFIFSNPEVIRESLGSGMANIAKGMENFLTDLKESGQQFKISTTDKSYFEIGKNLATTEGKIIYQNDLIQLICYQPKNKTHEIPIFIVPPWINKYYILDLSKKNSFVKWLVDNNFQVFLVSWVNPDKKLAHKDFEDYLQEGILQPYEYLQKIGIKKINAIGYCIGGTLLATALAYLSDRKQNFVNSATFLTTLIDFSKPGEIGAIVNKANAKAIEENINNKGYLDGSYLSNSFSLIRANDLVWSFFVNNYLLGKRPSAFDILFWNSDSTNLPAKMSWYYLNNMYLENNLAKPGKLEILGVKIDMGKIKTPSFSLAAEGDHISLWTSVYDSFRLIGGNDKTFCLTEAGHIAGVINPVNNKKYSYLISNNLTVDSIEWKKGGEKFDGSWWQNWREWVLPRSGSLQKSIDYKNLTKIEDAPGSYVMNNSQ